MAAVVDKIKTIEGSALEALCRGMEINDENRYIDDRE
jgi:hypothetical protein